MTKSSNRFFDCFRPATVGSSIDLSCPSPSGIEKEREISSDGKRRGDQRTTRRSLRGLARSFISHTASVTKHRRTKSENKLNSSYSSRYTELLSKNKQDTQSVNDLRPNDLRTNSTFSIRSSSINSTSSTSSTALCSSSGSSVLSTNSMRRDDDFFFLNKPIKQLPWYRTFLDGIYHRDLNFGLCLFFVSLLILMVWGKACAIFCTSILLVLVPRRVKRVDLVAPGRLRSRQMDLREHKKAVIMEGLLSRNRNYVYSYRDDLVLV